MRREIQPIDYGTKDYEGFRQLMIDLIPKYTPEWTDTTQSDLGIVLIELLANGLDVLSYYQDKSFNEAFLPTAMTRKSVINLCRMLGYELAPQSPAVHEITFNKRSSFKDDLIVIPKGTPISTDGSIGAQIVFELLDGDVRLAPGVDTVTALATHGITVLDDILGASDGSDFLTLKLLYPDVLVDTLDVVTVENGREIIWDRVENLLSSNQEDRHYTVSTNESNEMKVQFGNGLSGRIPPKNVLIKAHYRVGGGEIGNVGLNTINSFVDTEFAGIEMSNTLLHLRGEDIENIERARQVAPKHFRNAGRAVTKADFEDIALNVKGVAKAKAVEMFNIEGEVKVYIAPNDFKAPPQALKDKVLEALNKVRIVTSNPIILDAGYTEFDVNLNVVTYDNYMNSEINERVEKAVRDMFNIEYLGFGGKIFLSTIVGEVMKVEGVRNVIVTKPLNDVEVPDINLAKLKDVVVTTTGGVDR